ncbi:OmpA family protein [Paucibacter sp. JuS9]|uniref:OmpA family protein n=1 Tax=Paucibacter sp. JuS9 TaxID=3228748 RepID=UPI003758169F
MNKLTLMTGTLSVLALAALSACSTLRADNPRLAEARSEYRSAQNDRDTRELASPELKTASEAMTRADAAWQNNEVPSDVDHWSYLAKQRSAIAMQTGKQRAAERTIANATASRDRIRLEARTQEADTARLSAEDAKLQAAASQRQSNASQREAEDSQREAAAAQSRANAAQLAADDARVRNYQLETQLRELNAKQTDRGMVITMGDVLFDNNRSDLKPGAMAGIDKLTAFMKQYPDRKLRIEGFTDSVGSDDSNQTLSIQRATMVRNALINGGVLPDRITVRGYGESSPVASNDTATGRQLNRRVEIVLSDLNGQLSAAR